MKTYEQMTEEVLEKVKKKKSRRQNIAKSIVSATLVLVLMIGTVLVAGQMSRSPGKTVPGTTDVKQDETNPGTADKTPVARKLTAVGDYTEIYDHLIANGYDADYGRYAVDYSSRASDDTSADAWGYGDAPRSEETNDANEYSGTNVQVEGIDEADVIKTDGQYIYAVSHKNVYIISAEGGEMETVATIPFTGEDGTAVGLGGVRMISWSTPEIYVEGDRLVIVSDTYEPVADEQGNYDLYYNYWSGGGEPYYAVTVYDIADRAAPSLVGTASVSGAGVSSRMTDGKLYIIASSGVYAYYAEIDRDDPSTYVPVKNENGETTLVDACDIYYAGDENSCTYLNVMEIALEDASVTSNLSLLGYSGEIMYQSPDNIFVARTDWPVDSVREECEDGSIRETRTGRSISVIAKISLGDELSLVGSAQIDGYLHNSFSMDEYEGYLRVVTSTESNKLPMRWFEGLDEAEIDAYLKADEEDDAVKHWYYDEETGRLYFFDEMNNYESERNNDLFVLDPSMNVVGTLKDLAPDERIYSCRFEGNDGYFVTYRETDPLFHVDLSDPANPRVIDELKIPGHSDYLQRFGEYMLGFGQDDDGFLKLSMFSEDENGVMSEIAVIALPGTQYSDALHDHHAILADAERGIICFGAYGCYDDNSLYGSIYYIVTWDGQEFGVAVKSELGEACGTLRGFYIGDYFYLYVDSNVAADTLTSYSLSDFGEIDRETMDEPNNDPDPYYSGYVFID